jgi:hypothetical protein
MPGVVYFVRDDDVGELTDALRAFVELFLSRSIPVSYQIIPAQLTQPCADYLAGLERAHPELIEFGQHGLHHQMTLGGRTLLREFGPERSLSEQRHDIERGLRMLEARLAAERPIQVFTPPQHKYDANTIKAAAGVGHKVFSAAYYATARHQAAYSLGRRLGLSSIRHHGISHHGERRPEADIDEVSISIDIDDGEIIRHPAPAIAAAVERAARNTAQIGFMLHHAVYGAPGGREKLEAIAERLASYGADKFRRLSELGRAPAAAGRRAEAAA